METFTPISALVGGAMLGLSASALLYFTGHIAGISGMVEGLLRPRGTEWRWRAAFVAGLLLGGLALVLGGRAVDHVTITSSPRGPIALAAAGLLVGFGTRLGQGCTSGHGICGLSRLSPRSLLATLTFMAAGIATVTLARVLTGGAP